MKELFWLTLGLVVGIVGGVLMMPKSMRHPPAVTAASVPAPVPLPAPVAAAPAPAPQLVPPAPIPAPAVVDADNSDTTVLKFSKPAPTPDIWEQMSLAELQAKCAKTEQSWMQKHFESYAKKPANDAERKEYTKGLFAQIMDSLESDSWWKMDSEVGDGDKTIHMTVMLKFYSARQTGSGDPLKATATTSITSADDLCYSINAFFTEDEKTETQSASVCHDPARRKNEAFYYAYNMSGTRFAPMATAILLPFPGKTGGKLEFLSADSGQWVAKSDFSWSPSNFDEWQEMHDRYVQGFH